MKNKQAIILLLIILLPTISAASTQIEVKTLPDHTVFISILNAGSQGQYIEVLKAVSDSRGKASQTFTNEKYLTFDVAIKVKKGENTLFFEKFGTKNAGTSLEFELLPESYIDPFENTCSAEKIDKCESEQTCLAVGGHWYETKCHPEPQTEIASNLEDEQSEQETTEEINQENTEESENAITGFSIFSKETNQQETTNNKLFWIIGIALVAILGGIIVLRKHLPNASVSFSSRLQPKQNIAQRLNRAEQKIREAQTEIHKIKNIAHIEQKHRQIQRDIEELKKLQNNL